MSKRSASKPKQAQDGPNPRQRCPCGSGRRFKACHGAPGGPIEIPLARPFHGLAGECELVALREFVPSAVVELPLSQPFDVPVTLGTVLPGAAAALVRTDGSVLVGLQTQLHSNDVSSDVAASIQWARTAATGDVLSVPAQRHDADLPALRELIDAEAALIPTLYPDFGWWIPEGVEASGEVAMSLERANAAIMPTERLSSVQAAYWVDAGERAHLRWVRPEGEDALLAALARLQVRGELDLGEGSRFAGSFRAHGLLVPVWDLDNESHPREWEDPAAKLDERLSVALAELAESSPTEAELRARDGLRGRQITLR
ncbi:MAG: DUF5926 family protein [Sciscionella sp.]